MSPPHPRGWSLLDQALTAAGKVAPAPAGMVPGAGASPRGVSGRPRTRGDGPAYARIGAPRSASPPHPRGWSPEGDRNRRRHTVAPAPAGMVRAPLRGWTPMAGRPRTRGDGPAGYGGGGVVPGSPPHPRGWSAHGAADLVRLQVAPAPAGMVLPTPMHHGGMVSRPRTRGDGPAGGVPRGDRVLSPPHPRGWSPPRPASRASRPVAPAPAGMVPRRRPAGAPLPSRPRTRGDGPTHLPIGKLEYASPPHPRGWSAGAGPDLGSPPVAPAPAGMVRAPAAVTGVVRCRPRTRGDGPGHAAIAVRGGESPPHPRGWSDRLVPEAVEGAVAPAPAGMVRRRSGRRLRP